MKRRGFSRTYGYIDDFLIIGSDKAECDRGLELFLDLLNHLGFYVSWDKLEVPSQTVRYLGIIIDTVEWELRLPQDKLTKLCSIVTEFQHKKHATKHQLLSLAGTLAHCAKLVKGGRTFSRRVINLAKVPVEMSDIIRLPLWFHDDINWWSHFAAIFNGKVSLMSNYIGNELVIYTDSSLKGFGGTMGLECFLGSWNILDHYKLESVPRDCVELPSEEWTDRNNINVMELWPVLCAIRKLWGMGLRNTQVLIKSDNSQVVTMINTGRSRNCQCMRWLRELFWISFIFNIEISASYIRSKDNTTADLLSRATVPGILDCLRLIFFW